MRYEAAGTPSRTDARDVELEHGCILCGGNIELRVTPSGAYTYCRACRWISHPQMHLDGTQVHVVHPAAGLA